MRAPPVRVSPQGLEPKEQFDADLHDIQNALSAARSYADVLQLRARSSAPADPALVEALTRELDRVNELIRNVRRETYQKGDVLRCAQCGYNWVHRKALGKRAQCRRCNSPDVERWKPETEP